MFSRPQKKIWIDFDNSPHVPFFSPIRKELIKNGYQVFLSARDCFQVCGLADLYHLQYHRIGRHYGKNKIFKAIGTIFRAFQLIPAALREKPLLAISHGSRSQLITSAILRIPSIVIFDYEHAMSLPFIKPTWKMAPDTIANSLKSNGQGEIIGYPGLKEDVYVIEFVPDPHFRSMLGIGSKKTVVTIRPPATEAHYHNPESEKLFVEVVELVGGDPDTRMVILPRNEKTQKEVIYNKWSEWCGSKKIIIPEHVVNGLDLIWASDLVVSGGGTMNREAAALGVPVYSIFRGKIGLIDQHLSETGRLVLIESVGDVKNKIKVVKRDKPDRFDASNRDALSKIVNTIVRKSEGLLS